MPRIELVSEENVIKEQLNRLEEFRKEPEPMDMATFRNLADYWQCVIEDNLCEAPDEVKGKFAEMFDLYAIIRADGSSNGYHVDLQANIPLEMEGDKPGAYQMVFGSSSFGVTIHTSRSG